MYHVMNSLVLLLFICSTASGMTVYMKNNEQIDAESAWRQGNTIHVRVNRDTLLDFSIDDVDVKKTNISSKGIKKAKTNHVDTSKKNIEGSENFSRDGFKKLMRDMVQDENFVSPYATSSPAYKPYKKYTKLRHVNNVYVNALYDYLKNDKFDMSNPARIIRWEAEISKRGFKRLDVKDAEAFIRITNKLFEKADHAVCSNVVKGANVREYLELLDEDDIEIYYNIANKAIIAELSKYPKPVKISEKQDKAGYASFFSQMNDSDKELYLKIIQNIKESTDEEVCWAGKLYTGSILNMKGQPRIWRLRSYLNGHKVN